MSSVVNLPITFAVSNYAPLFVDITQYTVWCSTYVARRVTTADVASMVQCHFPKRHTEMENYNE